ncbi:MAG: 1-(5-phosphoribosyl)-5-[(5-phosphoribosylamino)methylideneamino]imidazole-4-carboxamide isomerase [Candidatus Omnitrophota bacterium]|jgi:phosphoribosylformimino-5-aminoimidazole carboxamide ribotide isomerase
MLIIPAIDLKDGCVVRYVQGAREKKIYSKDPLKTAKHWVKQGTQLLHLVDLDGAFTGIPKNIDIVKMIVKNISVPVEFGGGVRKLDTINTLLGFGVKRVVLGTKAVSDENFLKKVYKNFKDRIIVSIDAKDGIVMTEGWRNEGKKTDVLSFAAYLKDIGFKQVIYTDTLKDGTLSGPNIKSIKELLKETNLKVIASGGISSLDDILKLKRIEKSGVIGVIIGKALYEGKFTLSQAIKL